jgi:SAM-dependent methyltransferase
MSPWDERYSAEGYAYGTEPNDFLREHAPRLEGPVLCLAEGEGRNAVYLASLGLDVTAADQSPVGMAKAKRLAADRGTRFDAVIADADELDFAPESFGAVVAIFGHMPPETRRRVHARAVGWLRTGGHFLLEAYTPDQTRRDTGGPREAALCMTEAGLRAELAGLDVVVARECIRTVIEGRFHTGEAAVVQFLARKP